MVAQYSQVLVFKTNISNEAAREMAAGLFSSMSEIEEWSIDLEDVDRVLRVVSGHLEVPQIISAVKNIGFECSELE